MLPAENCLMRFIEEINFSVVFITNFDALIIIYS